MNDSPLNILYLTLGVMNSVNEHSIYADLPRCFRDHGHNVYTVSQVEKKTGMKTEYKLESGIHTLHLRTGNLTRNKNVIEKGLVTLSIGPIFLRGIKKYLSGVKFDLVVFTTPSVTFGSVVNYVKRRDGARVYLILKDIFPQNAVDMGMLKKTGVKGLIYRYFRSREVYLYKTADRIGCMSRANVEYLLAHNGYIDGSTVGVCPNSIFVRDNSADETARRALREKYGLPLDKTIFVYGGNLGKPQAIPFIIECVEKCRGLDEAFFLIIGDGADRAALEEYAGASGGGLMFLRTMDRDEYDVMIGACDYGLIFLDHRFTIPNYPSRILPYMQAKLPVLAATDTATDIGTDARDNGFGVWIESTDAQLFRDKAEELIALRKTEEYARMQRREFEYLNEHFSVERAYREIIGASEARPD